MSPANRPGSVSVAPNPPAEPSPPGGGWLPPGVPLLLGLAVIILPLSVLTALSLLEPLLLWGRSLVMSNPTYTFTTLPAHFFVKLAIFLVLWLLGGGVLLMRLKAAYVSAWAAQTPRPNPLHVDYETDNPDAIVALLAWSGYRLAAVLAPPLICTGAAALVGSLALTLLGSNNMLPFISLPIQMVVSLFLLMVLGLFTAVAGLNGLWTLITTGFGDLIALTEPTLTNRTILERCGRLCFQTPGIWGLGAATLVFWGWLLAGVYFLGRHTDLGELLAGQGSLGLILVGSVLTLVAYLGLLRWKFALYHHSLVAYYAKLPASMLERFQPPSMAVIPTRPRTKADVQSEELY